MEYDIDLIFSEMTKPENLQKICDEYNSTDNGYSKIHHCEKCKNRRYFEKLNEQNHIIKIACECLKTYEIEKKLYYLGLKDLKNNRLNNFKVKYPFQKLMLEKSVQYLKEEKYHHQSFLLSGQIGGGKTHIASAITVELFKRGLNVLFVTWNNTINDLKKNNYDFKYRDKYERVFSQLTNCDVLVIDDFLKGKQTEIDVKYAFEIINERYYQNKTTIITTEHSIKKLIEIDEALASRLVQMCNDNVIEIEKNQKHNFRLYKNN